MLKAIGNLFVLMMKLVLLPLKVILAIIVMLFFDSGRAPGERGR